MKPVTKEFENVFSRQNKRKTLDIDSDHEDDNRNKKSDNISQEFALTRSALYRDESPSQQHSSQAQVDSNDDILDRMFNQLSTDEYQITPESAERTRSQNQTSIDRSFRPVQFDDPKESTQPNIEITKPQTSKTTRFSTNERQ